MAMQQYLRVKSRILYGAVDEHPEVVLDHERLHVGMLVLLVDLLHEAPAIWPQAAVLHVDGLALDMSSTTVHVWLSCGAAGPDHAGLLRYTCVG